MSKETTPEQVEILEITIPEGKEAVIIPVPEDVEVELQYIEKEEPVAPPTQLDNILTLGLVGALSLAVVAVVIRKAIFNKKAKAAAVTVVEEKTEPAPAPTAPGSAGGVKLYNVEPKTAAMLMAIVADKLGKPLNELRFISIKEVN